MVDSKVPVFCCGEIMQELIPNVEDASQEKHVPVVSISGEKVKVEVGSVLHPMMQEHYITNIVIGTNLGYYMRHLNPNDRPEATYDLQPNENVIAVYEYCNLHGLWEKNI